LAGDRIGQLIIQASTAGLLNSIDPREPHYNAAIGLAIREVRRRATVAYLREHLHYNYALLGSGVTPESWESLKRACDKLLESYAAALEPWDIAENPTVTTVFKTMDDDWQQTFGKDAPPDVKARVAALAAQLDSRKSR